MTTGQLGYKKFGQKKQQVPRNKFVDSVVKFFVSAFYFGYIPVIPGTMGSLLGVLLYRWIFMKMNLHPLELFFIYTGYFLVGVFLCSLASEVFNQDETNLIVIDKSLGAMIAMSGFGYAVFSTEFTKIFVSFMIFRFWEILKIPPLKQIEKLPKGWGMMADDVAAGIITLVIVTYAPQDFWTILEHGLVSGG